MKSFTCVFILSTSKLVECLVFMHPRTYNHSVHGIGFMGKGLVQIPRKGGNNEDKSKNERVLCLRTLSPPGMNEDFSLCYRGYVFSHVCLHLSLCQQDVSKTY